MDLQDVIDKYSYPQGEWSKTGRRREIYRAPWFRSQKKTKCNLVADYALNAKVASLRKTLNIYLNNELTKEEAEMVIYDAPVNKSVSFEEGVASIGEWEIFKKENYPHGHILETLEIWLNKEDFQSLCELIDRDKFESIRIQINLRKQTQQDNRAEIVACSINF